MVTRGHQSHATSGETGVRAEGAETETRHAAEKLEQRQTRANPKYETELQDRPPPAVPV
jgi:hypothetical protein